MFYETLIVKVIGFSLMAVAGHYLANYLRARKVKKALKNEL